MVLKATPYFARLDPMPSRRQFMKQSLLSTSAAALTPALASTAAEAKKAADGGGLPEMSIFTKHFEGMEYEALADAVAAIGVKSIEAPIRPKGHVEPARVEEDLPKLVEVLKSRDIRIAMMTTGINAVNDEQHTEKVLRTAKALGIPQYRMTWYRYDLSKPIWEQLQSFEPILKDLVALSKEVGVQPLYQNHSGASYCGAPIWDAYTLLRNYKPEEISFAFDIMHAQVEGSESWPLEFALVKDRIGVAYFKNFRWGKEKHEYAPLGEGIVTKKYVTMLKKQKWTGPVVLHVEYLKGDVKDKAYIAKAVETSKRDLATLREWWETA